MEGGRRSGLPARLPGRAGRWRASDYPGIRPGRDRGPRRRTSRSAAARCGSSAATGAGDRARAEADGPAGDRRGQRRATRRSTSLELGGRWRGPPPDSTWRDRLAAGCRGRRVVVGPSAAERSASTATGRPRRCAASARRPWSVWPDRPRRGARPIARPRDRPRQPDVARSLGSGRGQVHLLDVFVEHPCRREPPDVSSHRAPHQPTQARGKPLGVALVVARHDLLLEDPVQVLRVGPVLGPLVGVRLAAADRPAVVAGPALVPPAVEDAES